jgi:hypothetical protein
VQTATEPYLSLSGTSMASPVVSGTIALMLQANPALTPNLVKAILEFTAETHTGYDGLTEGAGFLNARGAVEIAQKVAADTATLDVNMPQDDPTPWSRHVIWGNALVGGDALAPRAWATDIAWGSAAVEHASVDGDGIDLISSTDCGGVACKGLVWFTPADGDQDSSSSATLMWGSNVLGPDDDIVWNPSRKTPQPSTTDSQNENLAIVESEVGSSPAEHSR